MIYNLHVIGLSWNIKGFIILKKTFIKGINYKKNTFIKDLSTCKL